MLIIRALECNQCVKNAELNSSVFLENITIKNFALLEFMKKEGYHQIPFENCKIPESQNYIEKLNFGLNISFIPINTRLNLLVSSEENDDSNTLETSETPEESQTPENSDPSTNEENTRILEVSQGKNFLIFIIIRFAWKLLKKW